MTCLLIGDFLMLERRGGSFLLDFTFVADLIFFGGIGRIVCFDVGVGTRSDWPYIPGEQYHNIFISVHYLAGLPAKHCLN